MTNIYFIRHCEPNFANHDDPTRELSPKGYSDTALVTEYLSKKSIDTVCSSDFKRAVDTVKPFADSLALPVIRNSNFRERQVAGEWIEDFNSFAKNQWADFDFKLISGESLREVQNRNISALKDVLIEFEGRNIAIGSHGTALSTIINYYIPDFGYEDFLKIKSLMPWIVHFEFEKENCLAITSIDPFTKEIEKLL